MKNYKNHKDTIIKYISIVDIVRIIDYATELSSLIPQENEILEGPTKIEGLDIPINIIEE